MLKLRNYLETNEMEIQCMKTVCSKCSSKMEDYSNNYYINRISNNLTVYLKELEKERIKPKVHIRKETTKIRAEIENRTIENINET